jgi:hypothetical protein
VNHPDPRTGDLDHSPLRQRFAKGRLVHVPRHCLDRREPAELVQHRRRDEIACVKDELCLLQPPQTPGRQSSRPARHMCVGDDGD